jgi:hypothetical protein
MITYKATNTLNGKFYIGSSKDLPRFEERKKGHHSSKEPYPFQRALRKNPEAFEWEYVEDEYDEPILEQSLLDMWFGKEQCYNLNKYADRPMPLSYDIAKKIAEDNYILKRGLYDPEYTQSDKYVEDRVRGGKKAKETQMEAGVGIYSAEHREKLRGIAQVTANRMVQEKLGMFDPEVRARINREHGGKIKGQRWANNGIVERRFKPEENLPEGWTYGRLKKPS